MGRVVVVGSLNVDRPWRVPRHPVVGETVEGRPLPPMAGGKGLNQAVAARRMGAEVVLVGCVGDDADGRWLVQVAADEGIDVDAVEVAADDPTGTALIVIDDFGANTVTVAAGANRVLEVASLLLERTDVVIAQLEVPVAAVAEAFALARAVGARTILNPSPVLDAGPLLAEADVLVVNEHEAAELAGLALEAVRAEPLAAAGMLARPGQAVVVTLGSDGVAALGPEGEHRVAGVAAEAIDTTGAGDCFGGVLAAGLASGLLLDRALERANRAASIAVARLGTVAAMPTEAEVEASGT